MNDEFLHALRRDPPPGFASELQRRLERQAQQRKTRSSIIRTMFAVVVIGGVAMAAGLLLRDRHEQTAEPAPVARVAEPSAPAPKAETAQPAGPVVTNGSTAEPQPAEAVGDDRPRFTVLTSALARPLAQALAEHAGAAAATPRVAIMEATEAFEALCVGTEFVIASRRIAAAELMRCRQAGTDIVEWKLGYQAVVLAAGPLVEEPGGLSPRDVYLALARRVPDPSDPSRLIDNPRQMWHGRTIDVIAPSDATVREQFVKLVMEPGCETFPSIRELKQSDPRLYDEACHQLRTDGHYREVPLTDTLVTQQLWAEPNQLLVLGYSSYDAYRNNVRTMLEGAAPTRGSLEDGTYSAARPVYAYAPRDRVRNPTGMALALELSSDRAVGQWGYLARLGLIPLDEAQRRVQQSWPYTLPRLESLSPAEEHRR